LKGLVAMTSISGEEAADRLAIRALIDAYAHCADRRDADVKDDGTRRFGERRLYVDWTETRTVRAASSS